MFRYIKREFSNFRAGSTMWDSPVFVDASASFKEEFWAAGDRVLLCKGVPAVLKVTAQLTQEPRRWNDDPKQALTCTITSPELVEFLQSLEVWLSPQLKGEFRSVVKPNLFGEQLVRGKLFDDTRLFSGAGERTESAPAAGATCQFLLQPRLYALNGQTGVTIRVLAVQPK